MSGTAEVVQAYRQLYRGMLRAVQYSYPERRIGRNKLREAFREVRPGVAPGSGPGSGAGPGTFKVSSLPPASLHASGAPAPAPPSEPTTHAPASAPTRVPLSSAAPPADVAAAGGFTDEDREVVKRTLWLLQSAAKARGLEHRIVKNLLQLPLLTRSPKRWNRVLGQGMKKKRDKMQDEIDSAMLHYDMTLAMLNKSMGLRLR